jgi:adenine deaminase
VKNGQVISLVELAIGGLMSTEKAVTVARKAKTILKGFRTCGCNLNNPNMQLSLLALVVIPELRLTDQGLVNSKNFTFLPVIEGPA